MAQSGTAFDTTAKFPISALNGWITFSVNGTYSNVSYRNDSWIFTDLSLNNSQAMPYLQISTEDSNVTIQYFGAVTLFQATQLSYNVKGLGRQTIDLGLGSKAGNTVDWTVFSNGTFVTNGWSVSRNGTITVTGLTGNIAVIYFGFTNELGNLNQPFYEQHSVAIAVAITFAATVTIAVTINLIAKRRSMCLQSEPPQETKP